MPGATEQITYIDIGSVDRDTKKVTRPETMVGKDAPCRARKVIKTGDVLVSTVRPNLNAVALVDSQYDGQFASTGFDVLRSSVLDPRWSFFAVRTPEFVERMSELVQGALYPAVRSKDVRAFVIPIAPLAEQKRIADKLEAVLGRVDACRARLDRVPDLLKRFRQSVLAAACAGRLTTDWREANVEADASKALRQRIAKADDDGDLPASWIACRVGDVMKLKNGFAFKSSDYSDEGIPLVRISNIQDGTVTLEVCAKIPAGKANWNFAVEKGDLLVAMSGATTGKFGIYDNAERCLQNQRVGNFKIHDASEVVPGFRNIAMQSLQRRIEEDAYGGAQPNISPTKIDALPFLCPPLAEQQEIVRRLEALFTFADRIEARLNEARAQVERLTPATLAKAFRGHLVPQDPTDEPASALLARLRQTKSPPLKRLRTPTV